eukprot:3642_1
MLQKNNKQYSHLSKQIHKTYLTYKPKSFTSKILCNLIIVSLLFVIIILITNEYAYLTDADIKNISAQPTMNKIEIEPWRIVENNSKFKINSNPNISDPIYIPLKNPWGTIYRPNRILCLIPTLWPHRKWKMDLIASTYGPECSKLMWVVDKASNPPNSYAGFEFLIVALTRHQDHRVQHDNRLKNIWEKMHRTWTKIFSIPKYINNYEWFLKADDDSFIVTQNLFGFLQYYDPSYTHYLGHTLRQRWEKENIVFNSGTCYVLSRQTLLAIGRYLRYLPSMNPGPPTEHCVDRNGAGEDPSLAACLVGVGIRPSNTLDHELRERFLIFRDTDHVKMYREDTWYWKYAPGGIGQGENCCSPYLISMHNYKTNDSKRIYPMLQKKK